MENIPGGRLTKGPGLETVRQHDVAKKQRWNSKKEGWLKCVSTLP